MLKNFINFFYILLYLFNNANSISITLNNTNHISIKGPIDGSLSSKWVNEIYKNKEKNLYIYISSPGGSVVDGYQIVEAINTVSQNGINVYCIGDVSISMAFVIFQSCPYRYIRKSSILMQHQMSFGTKGEIEKVKSYVNFINNMKKEINLEQSKRLKLKLEDFENKIMNDWWLYGNDIIKNNAADKIITVICSNDLLSHNNSQTYFTFFGPVKITYSNCPLVRGPLNIHYSNTLNKDMNSKVYDIFYFSENLDKYNKIDDFI